MYLSAATIATPSMALTSTSSDTISFLPIQEESY
jgi:hypothetical protein